MSKAAKIRQQGDDVRCEGVSFQELLDMEEVPVPDYLRENTNPHMGDEDLPVERYITREFQNLEKEKMWSKVWQMVCREEDIPEVGDHHVYELFDQSVLVTRSTQKRGR